ncbi:hypothetical protein L596_018340 [Steinernema carpocapsae]|uniref:ceramide glucosyltransferase n=1 Tax=Steinernema carpocapsae TaxID=34508 RepID=A0A4V6A210_STECR|nr:hypothetical protein L596_018340 [Steinernema carpocapsae]
MEVGFLDLLWLTGLIFMFCLYAIHLIAIGYGLYRLHKPGSRKRQDFTAVSIIKPLLGADGNLKQNLESYFQLDYPEYEILFCAMDKDDEALEVARALCLANPSIPTQIFVGGEVVGLNPKVNNMMPAYRAVRHPLVLFSDAGIFMRPQSLRDMVEAMNPHVGLVFQVPYALPRPGFGALVEQIYFGTDHAKICLAGRCLHFVGVSGMSSLVRKKALDDCGGIRAFNYYIAEDHLIALALKERGWEVDMCSYPALQNAAGVTTTSFHDRMFRWMKLRLSMVPLLVLLDPLHDCFISGFIGALSAHNLFAVPFSAYLVFHFVFWFLCDYSLVTILQNGVIPISFNKFLLAWSYRELTTLPTFFRSLLQPEFVWRTGIYRLRNGGIITEAKKIN